jgi:hypothetical protein
MVSILNIFLPMDLLMAVYRTQPKIEPSKTIQVFQSAMKKKDERQKMSKPKALFLQQIQALHSKRLSITQHPNPEKILLRQFLADTSKEFRIHCYCRFKADEHALSIKAKNSSFRIQINLLYILAEVDIDYFLSKKSLHRKGLKNFISSRKSDVLEQISEDLVSWFNAKSKGRFGILADTTENKMVAKEILVMHTLGKLSQVKRFLLTHELGHAYEHKGRKPLGEFDPKNFDFIQSHQYGEVRADLTAARKLNAHEVAIALFEWRSHFAPPASASDPHPTDLNRAKALQLDYEKILGGIPALTAS